MGGCHFPCGGARFWRFDYPSEIFWVSALPATLRATRHIRPWSDLCFQRAIPCIRGGPPSALQNFDCVSWFQLRNHPCTKLCSPLCCGLYRFQRSCTWLPLKSVPLVYIPI